MSLSRHRSASVEIFRHDFLDTLRPGAFAFELGEAERKALNLRLVSLP
jgi:hypothetical protein